MQRRYELLNRLGEGGMGEIFRAVAIGEDGFRRPVAIKRIRHDRLADPRHGKYFQREALFGAQLRHPNIVPVLDFCRDDAGHQLLVMDLIDGVSLARMLETMTARGEQMPFALASFIVAELLRALDYAHGQGILHRDVSPHNVLISRHGAVMLSDFGLALSSQATQSSDGGVPVGKPAYLSPEQIQGWTLDCRADLYAVGVVLYEMLTHQLPYQDTTFGELVAQVMAAQVTRPSTRRPDVPPELDALTLALLAKDRGERCGSARDALALLPLLGSASSELGALVQRLFSVQSPQPELSPPDIQQPPAAEIIPSSVPSPQQAPIPPGFMLPPGAVIVGQGIGLDSLDRAKTRPIVNVRVPSAAFRSAARPAPQPEPGQREHLSQEQPAPARRPRRSEPQAEQAQPQAEPMRRRSWWPLAVALAFIACGAALWAGRGHTLISRPATGQMVTSRSLDDAARLTQPLPLPEHGRPSMLPKPEHLSTAIRPSTMLKPSHGPAMTKSRRERQVSDVRIEPTIIW